MIHCICSTTWQHTVYKPTSQLCVNCLKIDIAASRIDQRVPVKVNILLSILATAVGEAKRYKRKEKK